MRDKKQTNKQTTKQTNKQEGAIDTTVGARAHQQ